MWCGGGGMMVTRMGNCTVDNWDSLVLELYCINNMTVMYTITKSYIIKLHSLHVTIIIICFPI